MAPKTPRPVAAAVKAPPTPEETATFTTLKKRWSHNWLPTEFKYSDGRRVGVAKIGVHIELVRGQEFKPIAFCTAFRGEGWKPGELLQRAAALTEFLNGKADDRAVPEVLHWNDRPRPMVQIQLEGENAELRAQLAQFEDLFEAAAEKNPELAALREKVMAGA
jgi:hypothetical protein